MLNSSNLFLEINSMLANPLLPSPHYKTLIRAKLNSLTKINSLILNRAFTLPIEERASAEELVSNSNEICEHVLESICKA